MLSEVDKRLEQVKIRVNEIKAKVNSLERELLSIKQSNIKKNTKETIYKSDDILFFKELSYQRFPSQILVTWEEANNYAKSLKISGHNDWRLPTIGELERLLTKQSIENYKGDTHHIFREFLDMMPKDSCFWSSTEENELYAWVVDFGKGYDYWRRKTIKYYALCVRKT
jgi:hypothetical protein